MSNAIQTGALLVALNSAIQAAAQVFLGTAEANPIRIYNEMPRTQPVIPCAIATPNSVSVSLGSHGASVANPAQENSFSIAVRQAFPDDPSDLILDAKLATANALIAELQSGANFAGIAILPLVTHVRMEGEADSYSTKVFEVTLSFSCVTIASHH